MNRKRRDAWVTALSTFVVIVGLLIAAGIVLMPVLGGNVATPKKHSLSNMKQTALAHAMYVEANDGFGPSPDTWMDQLMPFAKSTEIFKVPLDGRKGDEFGYAYYRQLDRIRLSEVENPEEVVLAFESSDLHWNANGGFERLPAEPYHEDGTIVFSFLDTHVKALKQAPKFEFRRGYPTTVTTPQQVADLLETCDAHSPLREYVEKPVNHDTIGVLLRLAQVDEKTLVEAARMFLAKSASYKLANADREGREDLLEMLKGLIVAYPSTTVHVCWYILINDNGKLKIGGEWPEVRMGLWKPRDFCSNLPKDLKKYGRRDISSFLKSHAGA
jgi:hypothetical protein